MNIIPVIQVRLNSSRLPSKALRKAGGYRLMDIILKRLGSAGLPGNIWIATGPEKENSGLKDFVSGRIKILFGDEEDVLSRYVQIIDREDPGYVFRINGDNPFVDTASISDIVSRLDGETPYDYVATTSVPLGMKTECVRSALLTEAFKRTDQSRYREHITLFIRENPQKYNTLYIDRGLSQAAKKCRFTVDYSRDLEMIDALLTKYPGLLMSDISEISGKLASDPELSAINLSMKQNIQIND